MTLNDFRKDLAAYHESPGSAFGPYEIGGEDAAEIAEQLKRVLSLVEAAKCLRPPGGIGYLDPEEAVDLVLARLGDLEMHGDIDP